MKSTFLPESTHKGRSVQSNPIKGPVLRFLLLLCLLFDAGLFQSCLTAGHYSTEDEITTDFYIPMIDRGVKNQTKSSGYDAHGIRRLDAFVFNDDALMRLDSYCEILEPSNPYISLSSGAGDKFLVLIANFDTAGLDISEISSYEEMEGIRSILANENPAYPVMSGECHFCAGMDSYTPVSLTPLLANVCVDFVKCNFAGKGYKSRTLENASVYLTDLSGSCEVLRHDGFSIVELENAGGTADSGYLSTMEHPEMIYRRFTPGQWTPIDLYCYPNDNADGTLGSPHTRLVVQGDIDGTTYYYPVEINQEGFGYTNGSHGISRNVKYSYSFNITRKGSTDPDILVLPEEIIEQGWIKLYPDNVVLGKDGEEVHVWVDVYPEGTPIDISKEDLDYDVSRGIYEYRLDEDGHGVRLTLKGNGTGMFTIDAGPPVDDGFLVIVVVNP